MNTSFKFSSFFLPPLPRCASRVRSGAVANHTAAPESRARIEGRGRWRGRPLRDVPLQAAGRTGFGAGEAVSEMCADELRPPARHRRNRRYPVRSARCA